MSRGIEGRDIFGDDEDRATFLRLPAKGIRDTGSLCYAWALMRNHYHLLLRVNEKPLSALMRPLNATYARFYGKRSNRHGYLFQDRFKTISTQDRGYTEELARYVHLNPVRAGVCRTMVQLDTYEWCGHSMLVGARKFPFQNTADVLKKLASDARTARKRYRRFIEERNVRCRGRKNLRAESRKLFAYLGHRVLGHPVSETAAFLGTSGPAVSKSLDKGEGIASRKRIRMLT
jgi:putative transposase